VSRTAAPAADPATTPPEPHNPDDITLTGQGNAALVSQTGRCLQELAAAVDIPGVDPQLDGYARERALLPGVRAAAALVCGLYLAFGALHLVAATPDVRSEMAAAAWATAAVAGVAYAATRWWKLKPSVAPHLAGGLAALAAGNSLLHLALTRDPVQSTNVMLVLVAMCAVVDDRRWSGGLVVGSLAGVAAVALTSPPDPLWTHFAFGFASALLLGMVLRLVRQRGLSSLERARRAAAASATHDSLTGLLNRRGLDVVADLVLRSARREGRSVAVLFIDLDGLKAVNDTQGHGAGDALLVDAARHLREAFREADAVSRLGGDEFAVLLSGTNATAGALLAQRASNALSRTPASAGLAVAPDPRAVSLTQLLDTADIDMYGDKQRRRSARPAFHQPAGASTGAPAAPGSHPQPR
jgi:diguanylate cyclase (GGDEF)-like protein